MTAFGDRIMEFLQSQPDVSMVRDASSRECGDAIVCSADGTFWMIALERGTALHIPEDPREREDT